MSQNEFADLMAQFRAGDPAAATLLVERFGPQIRRAIRVRLTGTLLRRVCDSQDVCQSVLRRLWQNRANPTLPDDPAGLVAWLATVALNRVREEGRRQATAKRQGNRQRDMDPAILDAVPAGGPSPLSELAQRDLVEQALRHLSPDDRAIALARVEGAGWDELARQHGVAADALRKRYQRAVQQALGRLADGSGEAT